MTDNEKAATFIGWKAEQDCQNAGWKYDGHEYDDDGQPIADYYRCTTCGRGMSDMEHHWVEAPDMSDPRNYMKALEAVCIKSSYEAVFCFDREGPDCGFTECGNEVLFRNGDNWGDAAVKALAALYDAEHEE